MTAERGTSGDMTREGFLAWVSTLVHAHRAHLLATARRRGLEAEDALDCVQDAFFTFLRLPDADLLAARTQEAGRLLSTLVVHTALNHRRKAARRAPEPEDTLSELAADLPSADELVARVETRAELVRCVERLSRMQQAVVRLRLLDERPGEEVSELLGLTPENVRIHLFRARQRLRECLELSAAVAGE